MLNAQQFETGVIIDSLAVSNSNKETYALYLPKTYDSNKPLPILFIFSPSGKGKNGVKTFVKSAEAYNYILICSNNSKNGSLERNLEIAQRLFNHVFSNFKILKNRIYLAGFSGGSRLATAIACSSKEIQGVIACGAGFVPLPSYIPSTQKFSYVGLCGDRDFNYQEMISNKVYLNRKKINNTFFSFDGKHKWPPNEQLLMAFNWLETVAIKRGYIKKSKHHIETSYLDDLKKAKSMLDNQPLIAVEHYERILNAYGSSFNLDTIRIKLLSIKKSKNYLNAFKSRDRAFEKEKTMTTFFLNRFNKDYEKLKNHNFKWWNNELEKLNRQEAKVDVQMVKMFERLRFKIFVAAYSKLNQDISKANQQQQDFCKFFVSMLKSK